MEVRALMNLFGGMRPMSRALGHASHTTVQGWRRRNVIPAQQQAAVLRAALQKGIPITPVDLIPNLFKHEDGPAS
jgi:hypothetical protein